jgi:predicted ATPase/DNA-binding winged helix-turn-helix (wHTH) protein
MDADFETLTSFTFGRFQALPHRRQLLADGQPIKLGGRAFDILMTLLEAPGTVVDRDTLIRRVWPGRIVEENVLWVQVSALRAAFGAERDLIRTVAGRGYQFGGEIFELSARGNLNPALMAVANLPPTNLPEAVSELIGRDDDLGALLSFAAEHRLVTLTGPGGIGKTRLALAAARQIRPGFSDGVWLAELAPLSDGALVPGAVAAAVGLELPGGVMSPDSVASALGGKTLLIVLDNCEHVVGAAALMAEALLSANPAVSVIATSREPLMVDGEWVTPVPALAVPAQDVEYEGDPPEFGAVQLFCERVRAVQPSFAPDRRLASEVGAICRRLDGIPLAIELAAARAATLGVEELAARLDDRFQLLTSGRRTALPRHQTLRATLDWSYELLPESERVALHRLGVFAGPFGLEAASAVIASPEITPSRAVDCLSNLVAKSLVAVEANATSARYRLLETTRAYALAKVVDAGELHSVARRHAEYYRDLFEHAEVEWENQPSADRLAAYGRQIDNLRAALEWSFSSQGDPAVGIALTAATVRLWMDLGLAEELRRRVERALDALAASEPDHRREMKLHAALGVTLSRTNFPVSEWAKAWSRALELAERLDDADYQLRALYGLNAAYSIAEQFPVALKWAERYCALAAKRSDGAEDPSGQQAIGICKFNLGDLRAARGHFARVFTLQADDRTHLTHYQSDPRVAARGMLARTLWQQGFPDQAMQAAESAVEEAGATNDIITMRDALYGGGCLVAWWIGDLDRAERFTRMLLDYSTRWSMPRWRAVAQCYESLLTMKRGDIAGGLRLLRTVLGQDADMSVLWTTFQGEVAENLGRAGRIGEGLALVETAIKRCETQGGNHVIAELLRVNGELNLLPGGGASRAETHFRQALDWARRQGALSWDLRAATSLARLLRDQGRAADALAILQPVYDQFTEGFDTADLKAAKALLGALR